MMSSRFEMVISPVPRNSTDAAPRRLKLTARAKELTIESPMLIKMRSPPLLTTTSSDEILMLCLYDTLIALLAGTLKCAESSTDAGYPVDGIQFVGVLHA